MKKNVHAWKHGQALWDTALKRKVFWSRFSVLRKSDPLPWRENKGTAIEVWYKGPDVYYLGRFFYNPHRFIAL